MYCVLFVYRCTKEDYMCGQADRDTTIIPLYHRRSIIIVRVVNLLILRCICTIQYTPIILCICVRGFRIILSIYIYAYSRVWLGFFRLYIIYCRSDEFRKLEKESSPQLQISSASDDNIYRTNTSGQWAYGLLFLKLYTPYTCNAL